MSLEELVIYDVESTAYWRGEKADEYPDDKRNRAAAETLKKVASDLRELEGSDLHKETVNLLTWDMRNGTTHFSETLSEMTRAVGFRLSFNSGREFLSYFVSSLKDTIHPYELVDVAPVESMYSSVTPQKYNASVPLPYSAVEEIIDLCDRIERALDNSSISNSATMEIRADTQITRIEAGRPEPRRTFLRISLESLRDNLAKMTGTAFAGLIAGLAVILAKYFGMF